MTPDGRARVSIVPKGDANDNAGAGAVRQGGAARWRPTPRARWFGIRQGGATVVRAFIEAGVLSFIAITILLFIVLRRVRDVAITMAPIVLTGF